MYSSLKNSDRLTIALIWDYRDIAIEDGNTSLMISSSKRKAGKKVGS